MRSNSTPQSVYNLEITKLAIFETIVSVKIYVGVGLYFRTFKHLAVAVVFAPLMLLRTRYSTSFEIKIIKPWIKFLGKVIDKELLTGKDTNIALATFQLGIWIIIFSLMFPSIVFVSRVLGTIYAGVRKPVATLKAAPRNWVRQCLCIDFFYPPDLFSFENLYKSKSSMLFQKYARIFRFLIGKINKKTKGDIGIGFIAPMLFGFIFIAFIPSIIYRITFKATSFVYLPYIFIVRLTLSKVISIKLVLERIVKGELEKTRRGVSYLILSLIVAKAGFAYGFIDRKFIDEKIPSKRLVENLFALSDWTWWQAALGLDAVLTFLMLYFADAALGRIDTPQAWPEWIVVNTISITSFLRASISLITMVYFFYVALNYVYPNLIMRLIES